MRKATALIRFVDTNGLVRIGQRPRTLTDPVKLIKGKTIFGSLELTSETATVKKLLAPLAPIQIIGIGLNYKKHADEVRGSLSPTQKDDKEKTGSPYPEHPIWFMKTLNTVQNPGDPIYIPKVASDPEEVDYECELAVIIGKDTPRDTPAETALDYVLGYTAANDVSARRWQGKKGGGQWCQAKSFDTFCPLGPALLTKDAIPDPQNLSIQTLYDDWRLVQDSNTSDMIFPVAELISKLSQDMSIPKGTVILTGTPEGVGFTRKPPLYLKPGQRITVSIEKIGSLSNPILKAKL